MESKGNARGGAHAGAINMDSYLNATVWNLSGPEF